MLEVVHIFTTLIGNYSRAVFGISTTGKNSLEKLTMVGVFAWAVLTSSYANELVRNH